jgi:hypothetical protein
MSSCEKKNIPFNPVCDRRLVVPLVALREVVGARGCDCRTK